LLGKTSCAKAGGEKRSFLKQQIRGTLKYRKLISAIVNAHRTLEHSRGSFPTPVDCIFTEVRAS
jgi:hypothetical protein